MLTYLFYDLETTGLNKAFDQVLHFAAIRTDLNLQEIDRYELKIKLNPDVIPSPYAMITHHIGIQEALMGTPELEAIYQIHQWLNTPGTISLGYNTLGFDDEFLRFSFYRNLLPPYTHQYANQCSRMDLYPVTVMYRLFKQQALQWPPVSLKLEQINAANHFYEGRSHHAMVDVEVTLALARQLATEPEMWEYVLGYFNKNLDQNRAQELPMALQSTRGAHAEGIMVYGKFGAERQYQAPVLLLGAHKLYKNQTQWLQLDTVDLSTTTTATIPTTTWVVRKKWGEPGFVLPPKERFLSHLSSERQAQAAANKAWLQAHPDLFEQIIDYHLSFTYPPVPLADVESNLYGNGFWSADEENLCRQFHKADLAGKIALVQKMKNPKLIAIAIRALGRRHPDHLPADIAAQFIEYMDKINPARETPALIDFKSQPRMTPQQALKDIADIRARETLDPVHAQLLNELEGYLKDKFSVYYAD